MSFLFTAFAVGIFGSLHCVGMCGPLVMALPFGNGSIGKRLLGSLLYNGGRITTYSLLGALFGLIGQGFALVGWQQFISISLGMLVILIMTLSYFRIKPFNLLPWMMPWLGRVKQKMRQYFILRSYTAIWLMGSLNGLLPCGLIYLGIAGAIATGSVLQGMLYMFLLGAGTLPLMLLVTFLGNWFGAGIRRKLQAAVPVFIWIMGLMLILRGLSLGIPYISPVITSQQQSVQSISICH